MAPAYHTHPVESIWPRLFSAVSLNSLLSFPWSWCVRVLNDISCNCISWHKTGPLWTREWRDSALWDLRALSGAGEAWEHPGRSGSSKGRAGLGRCEKTMGTNGIASGWGEAEQKSVLQNFLIWRFLDSKRKKEEAWIQWSYLSTCLTQWVFQFVVRVAAHHNSLTFILIIMSDSCSGNLTSPKVAVKAEKKNPVC